MRLATFNLLHGRSIDDGQVVPERLVAAVRKLDADVVALQEVDRGQPRSAGRDLTAEVAAAAGAHPTGTRFAAALHGTPGGEWSAAADPFAVVDGPAYGVGLVSRLPVRAWHVLSLAAAPVRSPVIVPGAGRQVLLLADEPRVGLAAVVERADGRLLTVAATHLSFVPGWNLVQLARLTRWLRRLPQPVVLLGDLNLPAPLPRLLPSWSSLARHATFPAPQPRVQLDHVLARGNVGALLASDAHQLAVSDHRALSVDLA